MTQEEKNELMERLGPQDYEAYMELRRQMDVLAADERMDDAQKAAFYARIREELIVMRRQRDLLTRRLQAFNDLIDEVETRLKETEKYDRRKKKKLRLLPPPPTNAQIDYRERQEAHFAQGMTFYKLFWVFFIGCFAGVVLETIYCLIQRGHYESRVGLIYGPFNLVYGVGALCLSGALYRFRNRGRVFSFVGGFIVGSVVEYACSWFQEVCFGSFIGSPQMNFFDAKLVKRADGVWAEFGSNAIKVPDAKVRKLVDESYIGKEVVMGIRPENIHDEERFLSAADNNLVEAKVEVVELMGSETYLYLKVDGKESNVVARVDPRSTSRTGDTVKVAFETNRLHFFDKDTELSILNR